MVKSRGISTVSEAPENNPSPPFRGGGAERGSAGRVRWVSAAALKPAPSPQPSPPVGERGRDLIPVCTPTVPTLPTSACAARSRRPATQSAKKRGSLSAAPRCAAAPSPQADLDTFCHFGEPLLVFDAVEGFLWCQSQFDNYVGYLEATACRARPRTGRPPISSRPRLLRLRRPRTFARRPVISCRATPPSSSSKPAS